VVYRKLPFYRLTVRIEIGEAGREGEVVEQGVNKRIELTVQVESAHERRRILDVDHLDRGPAVAPLPPVTRNWKLPVWAEPCQTKEPSG